MGFRLKFEEISAHSRNALTQVLILLPLAVFLPSTVAHYGRLDDFGYFLFTRDDEWGVVKSGLSYGRPVSSLIFGWSFAEVQSIHDFSTLRFFSLLVLCLIFVLTPKVFGAHLKMSVPMVLSLALLFLSLPGVWVFMTWAQGLPHFFALLFALLATHAYIKNQRIFFLFFSFLAMFTYQPFGLLIPVFVVSLSITLKVRNLAKDFVVVNISVLLLLLSNFALVKIQPSPNRRASLSNNIEGKLVWFFSEWLPRIAFPWEVKNHFIFSIISLVLFGTIIIRFSRKFTAQYAFFLATCMFLPSIPFVLSTDNWASSRGVLASNIAYGLVLTTILVQINSKQKLHSSFYALLSLTVIYIFSFSISQGYSGLVYPQTIEWSLVSQQIRSVDSGLKEIRVSLAPFEQTNSHYSSYDEFGIQNSSVEVPLRGMLMMALAESKTTNVNVVIESKRICHRGLPKYEELTGTLFLFPLSGSAYGCQ